jgi:enoyl-CoA hydratase/carnithine racemase
MSDIQIEFEPPLAWVSINRADKRNALTSTMWLELPKIVAKLEARDDLRVVLLQGRGGGFSAGADIAEMQANLNNSDAMRVMQQATQEGQEAWHQLGLPTIALISGACFGGGCGLAVACDLRLATPDARFAITPAKLGLAYSLADTRRLVDLVGPARAKQILFTAASFEANEALAMGLVNRIVPAAELATAARVLAQSIAAQAPNSVRIAKTVVNMIAAGHRQETAQTLALFNDSFASPQFKEGAAAFLEKRPPRY